MKQHNEHTLESRDTVRRITEEEDEIMVSFLNHDGYFRIPAGENRAALHARLTESRDANTEIRFVHDAKLNILAAE